MQESALGNTQQTVKSVLLIFKDDFEITEIKCQPNWPLTLARTHTNKHVL